MVLKKWDGLIHRHGQDVGDTLATPEDAARLWIETGTTTGVTEHADIWQEVHFDLLPSMSFAQGAAAITGVKREPIGFPATHLGFFTVRQYFTNRVPETYIGRRRRPRGLANRCLVNLKHAID